MAHFVLEYSDNLAQTDVTVQTLFTALHEAAEETGLFPYKGIRSRAYCCTQYRMADGNPEHGFAHLEVKLGAGRSLEDRQAAADSFFKVFGEHFSEQVSQRGMAISFEMKELELVLKFNKNNVQDYL
jgi:5-carboxymethyl-2-hydroxymuconate isomerase